MISFDYKIEERNWSKVIWSGVILFLIYLVLAFIFLPKYALLIPFFITFALTFTFITINRSKLFFLAFISLLPILQHFNVYGLYIGDFLITIHMLLLAVIIVIIFNKFLYSYNSVNSIPLEIPEKVLLALVLVSLVSLIFPYSFDLNHHKRWLLFYTGIVETVSFYFIIRFFLYKDKNFIHKLILVLILTVFASSIVAFFELREFGFSPVKIYLARTRIGFGYHNMNLFGINSALLVPICFYAATSEKFKNIKILTHPALFLILLLSALTLNRGTFIILSFQLILLFFIKPTRKFIYITIIAGISALIYFADLLFIYLFRFLGTSEGNQISDLVDKSAQYRFDAWLTALKLIFLYPLGLGAGGFQFGWEKYGTDPSFYLGSPHQLFLSVGVDYGVLTMLAFILFLFLVYKYSVKLVKSSAGEISYLQRFISISLIGYIFYGLITVGELSHLSGFKYPNNGYTLVLLTLIGITIYNYNKIFSNQRK